MDTSTLGLTLDSHLFEMGPHDYYQSKGDLHWIWNLVSPILVVLVNTPTAPCQTWFTMVKFKVIIYKYECQHMPIHEAPELAHDITLGNMNSLVTTTLVVFHVKVSIVITLRAHWVLKFSQL